jgi:putative oxidoreductase
MKWTIRILQGFLVAGFLMSGLMKLISSSEQIRQMFTEPLGYGIGFMYGIGVFETAAALVLLVGFWKRGFTLVSSALLILLMIGAVGSNLKEGLLADAAVPLVYLVLLGVLILARGGMKALRAASGKSGDFKSNKELNVG